MRVFLTGASGFVGSAIVPELIRAGHQVLGLVRSETAAKALIASGAEPHMGSLEELDSLRSGAANVDAVIHTAFIHDFSKFAENCAKDRAAIEAIGTVLAGSDRPFVVTSGLAGLAQVGQRPKPMRRIRRSLRRPVSHPKRWPWRWQRKASGCRSCASHHPFMMITTMDSSRC